MKKTVEELNHKYPGIVDLIDPLLVEPGRAVGNTTRHVDRAVQLLMKGIPVLVHDPFGNGDNEKANRFLFDGITRRMHSEHRESLTLDKSNSVIQLMTQPPIYHAKV